MHGLFEILKALYESPIRLPFPTNDRNSLEIYRRNIWARNLDTNELAISQRSKIRG